MLSNTQDILWNCTNEEYQADNAVSYSRLKVFIQNPELYQYQYVQGMKDTEPKRHFIWGSDFERLVFYNEEPGFLIPESALSRSERDGKVIFSRRGVAWKEFESRMKDRHGENVRLHTAKEFRDQVLPLLEARDKLRAHDKAKKLILGEGVPHVAFRWHDTVTGLSCKSQVDMIHGTLQDPRIIVDLKTAADSSADKFTRAVGNWGYHLQAWWYRQAVFNWCGEYLPFVFVVVQSSPPYTCEVYELNQDWYDIAEKKIRKALPELAECRQEESYHTPTHNTIVTLEPKPWDYS